MLTFCMFVFVYTMFTFLHPLYGKNMQKQFQLRYLFFIELHFHRKCSGNVFSGGRMRFKDICLFRCYSLKAYHFSWFSEPVVAM